MPLMLVLANFILVQNSYFPFDVLHMQPSCGKQQISPGQIQFASSPYRFFYLPGKLNTCSKQLASPRCVCRSYSLFIYQGFLCLADLSRFPLLFIFDGFFFPICYSWHPHNNTNIQYKYVPHYSRIFNRLMIEKKKTKVLYQVKRNPIGSTILLLSIIIRSSTQFRC